MATHRGNAGLLKLGAVPTAVAELTGFTIQESVGTLDDTVQGDAARTFKSDALPTWSGSMRGHYFPGDTNGQAVVKVGAELAFEGSPTGTTNGLAKLSGTIVITGRTITSDNGAIVGFEATFQGSGPLVEGLHAA